jgi:hypothetical protein
MFRLCEIVSHNTATFYEYETGSPYSIAARLRIFTVGAAILPWLLERQTDNFMNAVLTAQAILVGFSFSVIFFLLSNSEIPPVSNESIERGLKREKLVKLARELFYNVSYYNLVAISSVVLALLLLSSGPDSAVWNSISHCASSLLPVPEWLTTIFVKVISALRYAATACLYFSLIESVYTFYRTVVRVSFYFDQKLKLMNPAKESGATKNTS